MGIVYKAHDPVIDREVAIKVILQRALEEPELPPNWQSEFINLMSNGERKLASVVSKLIDYQRIICINDLGVRPFETDMFVFEQKQAIAKYAEWVKENGSRFQPGKWYFAGTVQ